MFYFIVLCHSGQSPVYYFVVVLTGAFVQLGANQGTEDTPSNSISVVDLATKKVSETIETGKGSHGVVTSPDGKRLYVTNMYENTVSVIDTAQMKVIDTIEVGETPNGISIMN